MCIGYHIPDLIVQLSEVFNCIIFRDLLKWLMSQCWVCFAF